MIPSPYPGEGEEKMEKETLIKLLLLCGVCETTIRYCTHLGVRVEEVEAMQYYILAEKNGRMEI